MDTFFEQIIPIKKTGTSLMAVIGIWLLALVLSVFLFLIPFLTNGSMDIDKITNKSSRKRIASFELSGVSRLEKFNPHLLNNVDKKKLVVACNPDDPDAYFMVCEREGKGALYIVFAPEERLKSAIVKFIPKFIANSAFK